MGGVGTFGVVACVKIRLGWSRAELAARRKSDPGKLALAAPF